MGKKLLFAAIAAGLFFVWMVHICGSILIAGRLLHSYGLKHREIRWRRSGMAATYLSMVLMILANIYFLPWIQIFSFYY